MNPGPLPLSPVTASSIGSSTIVTRPIAPKISSTTSASCSVAVTPRANAVAPSPTAQARFGMIRTTRPRPERAFSMNAVRTPAARVMTNPSRRTWPAIPATSAGMSCGFSASTRMSDSRARSATVSRDVTPCFAAISFARAGTASLTRIRDAGTTRPTIKPRTSASPIFPTPAIPMTCCVAIFPPSARFRFPTSRRRSFLLSVPRDFINSEMPCEPSLTNVDVHHDDLVDLLGQRLSLEECVDRITFMGAGPESVQGDVMTFDIFPNRPDLYSVEGIARGLRGFLGLEVGLPSYRVEPSGIEFVVDPSVADVRPYAVGGVVRGIELDDALLRSLVDLQEKLHLTAGRRRRKVAIGIHDLDKVTPPYRYQAVRPHEVRFTPLGLAEELDLAEILAKHDKGREYAPLVASKPRFPIIRDARGQVLSFPPVINGIVTQLTPDTRNLFLDVTGTDLEAVQGCLAILATALAERGGRIQTVRTKYSDRTLETPDLSPATHSLDLSRANAWLGLSLTPAQAVEGLRRMRHDARADGETLSVLSPAYRLDLLHEVDLAEDLAISAGYDRYPRALPRRPTIGEPLAANDFAEALRGLLVGYGDQEVMSLTVAASKDPFEAPDRVVIQNPLGDDFSTLRSSMLPALLTIFRLNKHRELPQRIFEIADVVVEARNVRRVAAAAIHHKASFTEAKSLVLSLVRDVGWTADVQAVEDRNFIAGRAASVLVDGHAVGRFGEIHPWILEAYALVQPALAFELDVEALRRH